MALLEVRDLQKSFHEKHRTVVAVDHVSFRLEAGECLGLVGESGCGKSTVASLILHLAAADGGQILFDGKMLDSSRAVRETRGAMQMIFQNAEDSLDPRYTLLNSVKQGLRYVRSTDREELDRRAKEAIRAAGLKESYYEKRMSQLSGGECQRAAIARALISEPKLLICDEATSALDVSVQAQILALLKQLKREKQLSYLFITHDLLLARHICDRIAVMQQGKIVETGSCDALFAHPQHPYTKTLLSCL